MLGDYVVGLSTRVLRILCSSPAANAVMQLVRGSASQMDVVAWLVFAFPTTSVQVYM
jgi:hypothetical protein